MSSDNITVLRNGYEAFARRDIPGVLAAFADDIVWRVPDSVPYGGEYHGHRGVAGFFAQLSQNWRELTVAPEEFIAAGDTIVVTTRISGAGAAGSLELQSLHLWRMHDGRAIAFTEYTDTARVLQALGAVAPALA